MGGVDNLVQNVVPGHLQMQNLNFWNDFGKGFKMGFNAVAQPASVIPGVGQIMGGVNSAVQQFVPGHLQNLQSMRPSPARYGICATLHW